MLFSKKTRIQIFTALLVGLLLSLGIVDLGLAQTAEGDPWSLPVNLSNSGGTIDPVVVEDAAGIVHVVWQNAFATEDEPASTRSGYAWFDGETWQPSQWVDFPFSPQVPWLVADDNGWVHAFWIDEDGYLLASRVWAANFGNPISWDYRTRLANSAVVMDALTDSDGNVHLVYLKPLEEENFPAGVYYQRIGTAGQVLGGPEALYTSPYFRPLSTQDANLQIASTGSGDSTRLYVTWDNRPRKQVLLMRSVDRGDSWSAPELIAGPDPSLGTYLPYNLVVSAREMEVLLVWQVGEPGGSCTQYYQSSTDRGVTWSEPQPMLADFTACPQDNQFYPSGSGLTLLLTTLLDRPYLLAWDGTQWSDPQVQGTLAGFEDPEIFSQVTLGCRQGVRVGADGLLVVGCDLAGNGDVWATSRLLLGSQEWFPLPSLWSDPVEVSAGSQPVNTPAMLADGQGRFHAFWTQLPETNTGVSNQALYYATWRGNRWSQPVEIFGAATEDLRQPSPAVDPQGSLLLVWNDSRLGELYFSWADSERARFPSEWALVQLLPAVRAGVGGHDLLAAADGSLLVAYTIPLNEGRGVYLLHSRDGGQTWSGLAQAFDAEAAGWEMVGPPQLTQTADGTLHLAWAHLQLPGESGPVSLYYARSTDGGLTWSQEYQVLDTAATWLRLESSGERTVHLLWLQELYQRPVLNHALSINSGRTWGRQDTFSNFDQLQGLPALASDPAGQLHLLQVVDRYAGGRELQHWSWTGERWTSNESLALPGYSDSQFDKAAPAAAAVAPAGFLGVVLPAQDPAPEAGEPPNLLAYTGRTVTLPGSLPEPVLVATPAPTTTPLPTATPLAVPTLAPLLPEEQAFLASLGPTPVTSKWAGVVLGGGLGLVFVVVVFSLRFWRGRAHKS